MITTTKTENVITISFPDRLETNIANQIAPEIDKILQENEKIVFDLHNVIFISSSFLRICIKSYQKKKDDFKIINTNPDIKLVLKIAGIDCLIK